MIRFIILGEPASKANSRELVMMNRKRKKDGRVVKMPASIKSEKARNYEASAILQIPNEAKLMLTGPVRLTIHIFYASERPDLDASIVKDVLQAKYVPVVKGEPRELVRRGVYLNDRQVKEEHFYHRIDRTNPRAEIEVEPMQPQQADMLGPLPEKPAARARRAHPAPSVERPAIPRDREPF